MSQSAGAAAPLDPGLVTSLRTEIVEAQKTQAELLKWKLIAVASVAAVALGFADQADGQVPRARLLVCLIPLICAYVDLLSLHIVVRIIVIAAFFRKYDEPYETFVYGIRMQSANPFRFELMALHGSSFVINTIIFLVGAYGFLAGWEGGEPFAFLLSGLAGGLATWALWRIFVDRVRRVSALGQR